MNALDLRADHPELLGEYTPHAKHRIARCVTDAAHRVTDALHRLVNNARVKPVGTR